MVSMSVPRSPGFQSAMGRAQCDGSAMKLRRFYQDFFADFGHQMLAESGLDFAQHQLGHFIHQSAAENDQLRVKKIDNARQSYTDDAHPCAKHFFNSGVSEFD